jgi:hypothetical protein
LWLEITARHEPAGVLMVRSVNNRLSKTAAVVLLLLAASSAVVVLAAVTLTYFIADGLETSVRLRWETASELDNAGFYVRRSLTQSGSFVRISAFIPSRGDSLIGATYAYTDTDVLIGTVYWYQLETVDFSQNSQFYDPVSALPGSAFATQTAIAATPATATPTATGTATSANSAIPTLTRTATATFAPTGTSAYPGPATATQAAFQASPTSGSALGSTPASTASLPPDATASQAGQVGGDQALSTATLIPLPQFTFEFSTPVPAEASPAALAMAPGEDAENRASQPEPSPAGWFTPGRLLFLGFILLVWVILGAWFIFSMKRMQ